MPPWTTKTSTTTSSWKARTNPGTRKRSAWNGTRARPSPSSATSGLLQRPEPERRHRLEEAAQLQRAHGLGVGERRDLLLGLRIEQDFPGARRAAKARREVGHVADRGILPALLEADHAERRLALRDADAQAHVVAELLPRLGDRRERLLQRHRHAHRALGGLVDGKG